MCLLFILFTNTILFSLFPISPCALSVNSDKIKDSVISTTSTSTSSSSSKISSIEGSGSVPANEILSDDEDFFSGSSSTAIDFSGDGSLDSIVHNTNTNNHNGHTIVTDPGNHIITSNTDDTSSSNHGDDDTKDEDDEEDEGDDDDGDGDGDDLDGSEDDSEDDGVGVGRRGEGGGGGGGGVEGDNHNHPLEGDNDAAESDNHDQSLDHHHPSIISNDTSTLNNVNNYDSKQDSPRPVSILVQPSMLAAVIGGIVVSLLCAILLAMFIIYRTRKKDEGSYICEPSLTSPVINHYGKASCNKFYDP